MIVLLCWRFIPRVIRHLLLVFLFEGIHYILCKTLTSSSDFLFKPLLNLWSNWSGRFNIWLTNVGTITLKICLDLLSCKRYVLSYCLNWLLFESRFDTGLVLLSKNFLLCWPHWTHFCSLLNVAYTSFLISNSCWFSYFWLMLYSSRWLFKAEFIWHRAFPFR